MDPCRAACQEIQHSERLEKWLHGIEGRRTVSVIRIRGRYASRNYDVIGQPDGVKSQSLST
jgi:hypothetical protein